LAILLGALAIACVAMPPHSPAASGRPAARTLRTVIEGVTNATASRYGAKDDLGTSLDHGLVDALDDVRPVEHERLVAAAGELVVALEVEVELLEGGTHAAVEDDHAVTGCGEEITHRSES